ncbi:Uncharacterised protein [Nocardia africana]|uniref:Uncharacterized protein n=1 Tax=Nocardia africana TaxID=134964 RepID=A0A378WR39_9NOCA|nr:Uncharacterised protein [Nocardia africana]
MVGIETSAAGRTAPSATPRRAWLGLAVLILPVLLVSMDMSVLYLAMPTLTEHLDPRQNSSCGFSTSTDS